MTKYSRKNKAFKKRGRKTHKQKGGEFTNEEINELHDLGFTDEHIQILIDNNLTNIQLARNSLQQINPNTGMNFTPQEIIDSVIQVNEDDSLNESNISADSDNSEIHDLDDEEFDFLGDDNAAEFNNFDSMNTTNENISMINDNDNNNIDDDYFEPLHLSDLDEDEVNNSNNTSMGNNSFGGKTKKRNNKRHRRKTFKKNKKYRKKTLKAIRKLKKRREKRRKTKQK
jgi:hypothetical protein